MACRGVLFAITPARAKKFLAADGDDAILERVEAIEEQWDEAHLVEVDKAWDAIHRALTDGALDGGATPLHRAILGGRSLYQGEDDVVALVSVAEVPEVARARAVIDADAFRERDRTRVPKDYAPEYGEEDLACTLQDFLEVAGPYATAAREGRAVLFTVDPCASVRVPSAAPPGSGTGSMLGHDEEKERQRSGQCTMPMLPKGIAVKPGRLNAGDVGSRA